MHTDHHVEVRMPASLAAWGSPAFEAVLVREAATLGAGQLPLQQGLQHGSHALDDDLQVIHLASHAQDEILRVRVGIHYSSVIAGCNCADDPTPVSRLPEYCVAELSIDTRTAQATVRLQDA